MSRNGFVFVVNPNAAGGLVAKQWPGIAASARDRLGSFRCVFTSCRGDAVRLTRVALGEGADCIVCVGGDGTLNEIVNGLMGESGPVNPEVALGYIPRGTGCDFIKTSGNPHPLEEALDLIRERRTIPIDLGRLRIPDRRGRLCVRFFHNVASFGLGGEVDERVNRTKFCNGFVSFMWATLLSVLLYNKKRIHLKIDGRPEETVEAWNVVIGNGQYHGGGMWVAPGARLDDGLFHITVIGDFSLPEVFRHFPKLYNGRLLELEKVRTFTGKHIRAVSDAKVLLDVDGEQPGCLPAEIDIVPDALRLITAR